MSVLLNLGEGDACNNMHVISMHDCFHHGVFSGPGIEVGKPGNCRSFPFPEWPESVPNCSSWVRITSGRHVDRGVHVPVAHLRSSNADASGGAPDEVIRIVARIRESWPQVRIVVRGDSGFRRDGIMTWCDDNAVRHVFGIAGNARLHRRTGRRMRKSRRRRVTTGRPSRRFGDFRYRTPGAGPDPAGGGRGRGAAGAERPQPAPRRPPTSPRAGSVRGSCTRGSAARAAT